MNRILAAAVLIAGGFLAGTRCSAAEPGENRYGIVGIQGGLEARDVLGASMAAGQTPEAMKGEGFHAQQLMQGLGFQGRPAVDARQRGFKTAPLTGPSGLGQGLKTSEPPMPPIDPGANPTQGQDQPPPAAKRDWAKIIQTWLPIAIFYVVSVQTIMNPVGMAAYGLRGVAVFALIGTVQQLIKAWKSKT